MLDLNRPVQTRDGKPVRIIATDIKGDGDHKLVALVDFGDEEVLAIRLRDGRLFEGKDMPDDFVNGPQVQYRAFQLGRGVLGSPMDDPDHVARGDPWNDKILKFTIADDGEVLSAELV